MKNTNKSFLINSSVAFVLAGMLATTLHEMAHFITALLLGDNAKIFPPYVQTSESISLYHHIIVASAGPLFSLISGLIIIWLLSGKGKGFVRLFWTWLGFLSAQIGFGYFLIAPLAKAGDTGFVLSSLRAPWPIYALVCAVGAIGTYLLLPRLFSKKVSPYAADKKEYFQFGMYPWLIGTAIMLAIYFVISGVIMHEDYPLFLSLAGTATIGIFTPMARFKLIKDKSQTLQLATPIVPIFITLIFALFLIFGLTHGIQLGSGLSLIGNTYAVSNSKTMKDKANANNTQPTVNPLLERQKAAMKKLQWLSGKWKGESWIMMKPGEKAASISSENVQTKLDGLTLLIEGLHYRKLPDGKPGSTALNALAIVSYNDKTKKYRFSSYTQEGQSGDFEAIMVDNKFVWTMPMPDRTIRYTIEKTSNDHWFETGESSSDGKKWNKFFEMNLLRVTK